MKLQEYVINYDVVDPQLRALAGEQQNPMVLEFAAAYNNEGTLLSSVLNQGALSSEARADGKTERRFRATQQLQVPPDAPYIRVGVRNTFNDRTGALEVTLPLESDTESAVVSTGNQKPAAN